MEVTFTEPEEIHEPEAAEEPKKEH
jgi:hypothetical protein